MPQPTVTNVHVDTLLTNQLIGFKNATYIADDAAPIVPSPRQTNIIPKVNQSAFFRDEAKLRTSGTESAGGGYSYDTSSTVYIPRYSYHHDIPDDVRDNTDAPFDQDRDAAFFVADKLAMVRERAFASNNFTTGVWGSDKTGGTDFNQWSNYGTSTPLEDVAQFKDSVEAKIGKEPNVFILGKQVLVGSGGLSNGGGLKFHPELIDTIKYTQKGVLTEDLIASLFGFDKILVGRAIFTSTADGAAESAVTYTRIWGKHGLMYYNPPGPTIWDPAAVHTYVWTRVASALQYIKRMRIETKEVDRIECNSYFQQKVIVTNAGVFLSGAVN